MIRVWPCFRLAAVSLPLAAVLFSGVALAGSAPESAPGAADQEPGHVYTNADLAKLPPIPQQAAPIFEPEGWDFVFSVLDRERALEERRREREITVQTIETRAPAEEPPVYSTYFFPCRPGLSGCSPGGPVSVPGPSNPYLSLEARGVRSAEDLFRESVRNSQIRRQALR